jgi:hypothetical protein
MFSIAHYIYLPSKANANFTGWQQLDILGSGQTIVVKSPIINPLIALFYPHIGVFIAIVTQCLKAPITMTVAKLITAVKSG